MVKRQLELTLAGGKTAGVPAAPAAPVTAQWWFEQMRRAVNQAGGAVAAATGDGDREPDGGRWRRRAQAIPLGLSRKMVLL